MLTKRFFALLLVMFSLAWVMPEEVMSQTVTVIDVVTQKPIRNVFIYDKLRKVSTLTDNLGKAELDEFAATDTLIFRHPAYKQVSFPKASFSGKDGVVELAIFTFLGSEFVLIDTKDSVLKAEVPSAIEVISAHDIAFANAASTPDLLAGTNGILVQKSQFGGGSPILRGMEANRVLLVVDGVRMNNAIYRSGHLQNSMTIDNQMLERAEIIFGPSSVIYGSDALGGVIHFVTRDPVLSKTDSVVYQVNTSTTYRTADVGWTAHIDAGFGFKKIAFLTSITSANYGDLRMGAVRHPAYPDFGKVHHFADRINGADTMKVNRNPNIHVNSGFTQLDLLEKVLWKPGEKTDVILNLQYSNTSDIPRYDQLTSYDDAGVLRWAEWHYGPQERLFASLKTSIRSNSRFFSRVSVIAGAQDVEESRITRRCGKNERTSRVESVQAYNLNIDFFKDLSDRTKIQYGTELLYNDVTSTAKTEDIEEGTIGPASTRYPDGGANMKTLAGYANFKTRLGKNLYLNTGARYSAVVLETQFKDTTFVQLPFDEIYVRTGALTGRFGLSWLPIETWQLRTVFSSGFRAPNVDDNGKVFEKNGDVVVPNNGLKPEYAYSGEFGTIKTLFDEVLEGEATFFYTLLRDAIVQSNWQLNGQDSMLYEGELANIETNLNVNKAVIYGFSLRFRTNIIKDRLWASTTYNYTYGRDLTDQAPLAHIPPSFGSIRGTYRYKWVESSAYIDYNAWKRIEDYSLTGEDNEDQATVDGTPSWYTLNVNTVFKISKKASVQLAVQNILDHHYKPFSSGISGPGRNFMIAGRVSF